MNLQRALQLLAKEAIKNNDNTLFQMVNSLFYRGTK